MDYNSLKRTEHEPNKFGVGMTLNMEYLELNHQKQ